MSDQNTKPSDRSVSKLTIEEVARFPLPGMAIPGNLTFSPDDQWITYLFSPDGTLSRQLYAFNPSSGTQSLLVGTESGGNNEENVSLEEALRRERLRQRETGVTQYAWAEHANRLLIPLQGDLYVQDGVSAPLRKIVEGAGAPVQDPQISPDGNWVAYVQDAELYVVPSSGGEPRQLTGSARGTGKTNGMAEFIAQEEMGRSQGFWWSPDNQKIAFIEVDETHIPVYRIIHQGKDTVGENAQEDHRYPFAGEANAHIRLGVISLDNDRPVWMDIPGKDVYLARINWMPSGQLLAQIENREQTRLDLILFDPNKGKGESILTETSEVWINLHNLFRPLKGMGFDFEGGFIWASERTGFRHLYLYDRLGQLIRPLTQGEWRVDDVVGVDETRQLVYFTASLAGPTESHLYSVPLVGGELRRITFEPGMHTVICDLGAKRFVDVSHAINRPPTIALRSLEDGSHMATIFENSDPRLEQLNLQPPELVTLQNRHGDRLYGAVFHPPAMYGPGPHPTVVLVYGCPGVQLVANSWLLTVAMRVQYLRSLGYLAFVLDNRGSARRGLAFEGVIKHWMGHFEVEDQVDGVNWLVSQGLTDPSRVGIFGWSGGGYMSAMCLALNPETFKVAVAGAPVTHFDGYDTHYTERYMGTPQSNPEGYAQGSVLYHVNRITGKLMLVHGLIDENVHFRHTARLINALIRARKSYDLLLFPDERHMPRKLEDRVYLEERVCEFFTQNL
jgi:dipeptidyl-peptidase-4